MDDNGSYIQEKAARIIADHEEPRLIPYLKAILKSKYFSWLTVREAIDALGNKSHIPLIKSKLEDRKINKKIIARAVSTITYREETNPGETETAIIDTYAELFLLEPDNKYRFHSVRYNRQ